MKKPVVIAALGAGLVSVLAGLSLVAPALAPAQQAPTAPHMPMPHAPVPQAPAHATPPGWKLTLPQGDATRGREALGKFECYACHEIRGEKFPAPTEPGKVGPELSAMGPLHEPDYFVESIINPGRLIEKGKGYEAPDGSSKMPSYNDSMSVQELLDLVAYLKSLTPPAGAPGHGGMRH